MSTNNCYSKTKNGFMLFSLVMVVILSLSVSVVLYLFLAKNGSNSREIFKNKFDETYFDKIEAIEYSLKHDDGQILEDLDEADIILIGPSRTSKTPTSVYLAYNGFKTANIPFVGGSEFPSVLKLLRKPIIFGFVINPSILVEIRENRIHLLQIKESSDYTDIKVIQEECREVRRLCSVNNWQVIEVSRRSIEETAAIIMKYYYEHKKMRDLNK